MLRVSNLGYWLMNIILKLIRTDISSNMVIKISVGEYKYNTANEINN